jgi:hypothetical protein
MHVQDDKETGAEDSRRGAGALHKRRTTLADGRYLIYYTFGDEPDARAGGAARTEPEAATEAAEERRV